MQSADDRSRTTFGKRRAPAAAPDPRAGPTVARAPRVRPRRNAGPLPWALRVAGLVGIAAAVGAYQLARLSRPDAAPPGTTLAAAARTPAPEPETTGAIGAARSARSTRLDPCGAPADDRLRP
ncbi:hypothetical protein ACLBXO_25665 [Methylobacterium sp. C33D]